MVCNRLWFRPYRSWRLGERSRDGRKCSKKNPRSAHTAHVWAHALCAAGEDKVVADYLEKWLPDYALDKYLSCHCWWHFCLSKLMLGEHDSVLPIYEKYCSPKVSDSPSINVFTDGAALLWRSELAGMDRSEKHWQELLEFRKIAFQNPWYLLMHTAHYRP